MPQATGGSGEVGRTARVALVTGAASGIGRATAVRLARSGWKVYATFRPQGRSAPPQAPQPDEHLTWLPLDVTDAAGRAALVRDIHREHGGLDALVNSAGVLACGPLEEISDIDLRWVMEVNFFGALAMSRASLQLLRARGGVIVMVSSLSGLIGLPFEGAYAASKFALEGASESLRHELEPAGIGVALIEPGAYATSLAGPPGQGREAPSTYPAYEALKRARAAAHAQGADPAEAAAIIEKTIEQHAPQLRVPCGSQARSVVQQLQGLTDRERAEFALRASSLSRRS